MNQSLSYISYAFAALAGLCFFGGIAILTGGRD